MHKLYPRTNSILIIVDDIYSNQKNLKYNMSGVE